MQDLLQKRVDELLEFLQVDYPRATALIRLHWNDGYLPTLFDNMLTYSSTESKQGFSFDAFLAVAELKELHKEINTPR